mmetsp:Transcript_11498/g.22205  ORF Transcript_11498/g.22205 Transcript_11498/m.22205 type:complete len:85 (-) Transcript_11498:412-666(-)
MPVLPAKPALFEGEVGTGVCIGCPTLSFPSICGASRCLDGDLPIEIKLRSAASPPPASSLLQQLVFGNLVDTGDGIGSGLLSLL